MFFFYFHPYLGKIPILTHIFHMGWNHQLDVYEHFQLQSDFSAILIGKKTSFWWCF